MRKKLRGFTLIELLVVIVIIGILATIGVATFQGYFVKSRDTQRQVTVRTIANVLKINQISSGTPDYDLDVAGIRTALANQGFVIPEAQQGINFHYSHDGADNFFVFACKESEVDDNNENNTGNALGSGKDSGVAFIDGTPDGVNALTAASVGDACDTQHLEDNSPSTHQPAATGYTNIQL